MAATIKNCVNFSSCSNLMILHVHFCSAENDVSEFIVKVETLWGSNIRCKHRITGQSAILGICYFSSALTSVYTTEEKWHGPDKNWNGSNSFYKDTLNFYPFRDGSIGACGPVAERIKVHCFFVKTVGTVPVCRACAIFSLSLRINLTLAVILQAISFHFSLSNFIYGS